MNKLIIIFIIIIFFISIIIYLIKFNPYYIAENINRLYPMSENETFETNHEWCKILRDNYETIKNEYIDYCKNNQLKRYRDIDSVQSQIDDNIPWHIIILRIYNKETNNMKFFPKTKKLISNVPNCSSIMFSVVRAKQYIKTHHGPYKGVLRYHLGLITPKNNELCSITINNKIKYNWQNGKDLIFDDHFLHHVENHTEEDRVILLLEIKKDFDNILLNLINSFILKIIHMNDDIKKMSNKA